MEKQAPPAHQKKSGSTGQAAMLGSVFLAAIVVVGAAYLFVTRSQVTTDKADIEAPAVVIASAQGGTLQKMLVSAGEQVSANTPVAQVGDQVLRANEAGLVIAAEDTIGKTVSPGEAVVTLIHPQGLRAVAHLDETNGLSALRVGQAAEFTVDAFGSKKYTGVVDEISPSSRQSGVVFNISDAREVRQFDVKIRFDVDRYPELKNGMSAKVTIYTN